MGMRRPVLQTVFTFVSAPPTTQSPSHAPHHTTKSSSTATQLQRSYTSRMPPPAPLNSGTLLILARRTVTGFPTQGATPLSRRRSGRVLSSKLGVESMCKSNTGLLLLGHRVISNTQTSTPRTQHPADSPTS